jgi:hypothetical protein
MERVKTVPESNVFISFGINRMFFETIIESASEPRCARFSSEMCASDQTQPNLRQQAIPAGRLLYFPADILIQRLL